TEPGQRRHPRRADARRERAVGALVVEDRQAELLQIVRTLRPGRRLADLLHRRQQEPDQHRDDSDDDEQLDEREAKPIPVDSFHGQTSPKRQGSYSWRWYRQIYY